MPNRNSTPRGAFGRPRIPAPPSQIQRRRTPGPVGRMQARIRARVIEPARRRAIQLLLLAAGIAAGIAIATTALSLSGSAWTEDPAGRPAAPILPDYAATIRAPTPTPGGAPAPSTDVPLDPQDVADFRLHTFSRVMQEATAIAAGTDLDTLMRVAAEPPPIAACIQQLTETLAQETLLPPTPPLAEQTAGCFFEALARERGTPHPHDTADATTRAERAAAFLRRYAYASDPTTLAVAALPSPPNMTAWRNSRDDRARCHATIPESARLVAGIDEPAQAAQVLGQEAQSVLQCLAEAALPRSPGPSGP